MSKNASTGPRSKSGKATSSQNSFKHGLASGAILIPGEDPQAFAHLEQSLLAQYEPTNPTESILVTNMARHHWLKERAIRLQSEALATAKPGELPATFPVLLRYQTTNERAFHKALLTLLALRKEHQQFVSQQEKQAGDAKMAALTDYVLRPLSWSSGGLTEEHRALIARNRALHEQKTQAPLAEVKANAAS